MVMKNSYRGRKRVELLPSHIVLFATRITRSSQRPRRSSLRSPGLFVDRFLLDLPCFARFCPGRWFIESFWNGTEPVSFGKAISQGTFDPWSLFPRVLSWTRFLGSLIHKCYTRTYTCIRNHTHRHAHVQNKCFNFLLPSLLLHADYFLPFGLFLHSSFRFPLPYICFHPWFSCFPAMSFFLLPSAIVAHPPSRVPSCLTSWRSTGGVHQLEESLDEDDWEGLTWKGPEPDRQVSKGDTAIKVIVLSLTNSPVRVFICLYKPVLSAHRSVPLCIYSSIYFYVNEHIIYEK